MLYCVVLCNYCVASCIGVCRAVLCNVALRCIVLLCRAVLYYGVLWCVVVCSVVMRRAVLCCVV